MKVAADDSRATFKEQLLAYKQLLDADIEVFCKKVSISAAKNYGVEGAIVSDAYTDILRRGGKRIRGALTMVGYEMCGGTNQAISIQTARSVEMMHAYMLLIDDIQDRAAMRRGGPSAHYMLAEYSNGQHWTGQADHTGVSLALNAAVLGSHSAQMVISNMDADPELRLKALTILNHTMMVTAHGQTHDIVNEISNNVTLKDIENVLQWKTAHYTVLNPIHMGMVMAGAGCEDTNGITEYAINVGKAFQITDDLLVVAKDDATGKYAIDDVREGKQTLLTVHVAQHAQPDDAAYLKRCLGDQDLTNEAFVRCQEIMVTSGAVKYARGVAEQYVDAARLSLAEHASRWDPNSVRFLDELAQYLLKRTT